jgi:anti-anti-sigma factor
MENYMPLAIKVVHDGGSPHAARVSLEGSLDTATSPDLEAALDGLLAGSIKVVAFDLAGLRFISSAGIRVLMKARKELGDRGGSLALSNPQPQITKVLEIVRSLPGVAIFANDREMDAYLTAIQKKVLGESE